MTEIEQNLLKVSRNERSRYFASSLFWFFLSIVGAGGLLHLIKLDIFLLPLFIIGSIFVLYKTLTLKSAVHRALGESGTLDKRPGAH